MHKWLQKIKTYSYDEKDSRLYRSRTAMPCYRSHRLIYSDARHQSMVSNTYKVASYTTCDSLSDSLDYSLYYDRIEYRQTYCHWRYVDCKALDISAIGEFSMDYSLLCTSLANFGSDNDTYSRCARLCLYNLRI